MNGGFPYDILIFAVVALFLILKLGTVLGRRGDDKEGGSGPFGLGKAPGSPKDNVVSMPERASAGPEEDFDSMAPLDAGLARIKAADRTFSEKEFVKGARAAFEMIVEAYASGDAKVLKSLLDDPVYENFAAAIREREKAGHSLETTLVGIDEAEIAAAEMRGRDAAVTVKFVSEQVNVTRDADGEVVEGDPNAVVRVTDVWTFKRDTRSADPNWVLVATGAPD